MARMLIYIVTLFGLALAGCRGKAPDNAPPPTKSNQELMRQLESNDPEVRKQAARELGDRLGEEKK